jgi:hypothetical protein
LKTEIATPDSIRRFSLPFFHRWLSLISRCHPRLAFSHPSHFHHCISYNVGRIRTILKD